MIAPLTMHKSNIESIRCEKRGSCIPRNDTKKKRGSCSHRKFFVKSTWLTRDIRRFEWSWTLRTHMSYVCLRKFSFEQLPFFPFYHSFVYSSPVFHAVYIQYRICAVVPIAFHNSIFYLHSKHFIWKMPCNCRSKFNCFFFSMDLLLVFSYRKMLM